MNGITVAVNRNSGELCTTTNENLLTKTLDGKCEQKLQEETICGNCAGRNLGSGVDFFLTFGSKFDGLTGALRN